MMRLKYPVALSRLEPDPGALPVGTIPLSSSHNINFSSSFSSLCPNIAKVEDATDPRRQR